MKRPIAPLLLLCIVLLLTPTSSAGSSSASAGDDGILQALTNGNSYTACPNNTNTTAAPPEKGKITLNVFGWASSPVEDRLVKENLDRFRRDHPNIQINWSSFLGDYATRMDANLANSTMPDVFYLQPNMTSQYIASDLLLNLSPYMARDHVQADAYSFIDTFSCWNGQVYGIPKDMNTLGVFYNKKMFREAGVPFPSDKWTWGDMRAAAKMLTKAGSAAKATYGNAQSVYGLTLPANSSRWLAFLFAGGGSVLNADGTRVTFNDDAGVNSLNFYTSFQLQDGSSILPSAIVPYWPGNVFDAFGLERSAMVIEGGWLIPYINANYPFIDYGIAPLPVGPTGMRANLIFTNAWAAYSKTQHPEAAWELIKYMTGQEVQESQLEQGFALPSLKSLAHNPSFIGKHGLDVLFQAIDYGNADYYGPYDHLIHDRLNTAIASVLAGKTDAQTALDTAASQINRILRS